MNRFGNIHRQDCIQQYINQQHHYQQIKRILEATYKFQDLLNSINQLDPNCQNVLITDFCCILNQQTKQIMEATYKFHDLLNSIKRIDPNYQNVLIANFCFILMNSSGKKQH